MADLLTKMPLQFEPLRQNRFILRFPADLGIQEWTLVSAKRPSINQTATEIQFLNTSTWVLGRYTWDDINVVLRDPIGPSTSQAVMEWIRLGPESVTGRQGYAAGYKRNLELDMLDPNGVVASKWILVNSFVTSADFGNLSMSDDALAEITITLKMDYAILAF